VLQIHGDRPPAAGVHVPPRRFVAHGVGAIDPQDLGAHVGQHHRRERPRPDPGELDHPDTGEGT
jgi:hypothetical protein